MWQFLLLCSISSFCVTSSHYLQENSTEEITQSRIRIILNDRYKNSESFVDIVYNYLLQNNLIEKYYDDYYAYDQQEQKRWLIFEVKEFERVLALQAFEQKFIQWYPHISDFMFHKIAIFIDRLRLSPQKLFKIVSSQEDFHEFITLFADIFNAHYRDVLTYEIDNQVKEILQNNYVENITANSITFQDFKRTNPQYNVKALFDQSKFQNLITSNSNVAVSTINHSGSTASKDHEDWSRKEVNIILERLLTTSADNQRLVLKKKLLQWFPQANDSIIDRIIEFLKQKNVSVSSIQKMSSNRQEFFYNFNLNEFILISDMRQEFVAAIAKQVMSLLREEFGQVEEAIEDVFDNFIDDYITLNTDYDLWLLFDDLSLDRLLSPYIDKYRLQAPEFKKLRKALNKWFPNEKRINHLIVQYLMSQKIRLTTARIYSQNRRNFLESPYIDSFAQDNRFAFNEQIYKKVESIVFTLQSSKKAQQTMLHLKDKNFDNKFTPQMLYNASLISQVVTDELNKLDMDQCLEEVNRKKLVYPSLKEDDCVALEICGRRKGFDDVFLQKEFQKYLRNNISGFSAIEVGSGNIKDEIDETIYDIIQQLLEEKEKSEKPECIVAYIKRNNKIDSLYNPELFFNDDKLMEIVENIVRDYKLFLING